ncbi:MAG: carboxylesterase family protein [Sandaracinaceae bacterium]|nr:carboxylesterase family protein [Sandaracinaceae bacterium]
MGTHRWGRFALACAVLAACDGSSAPDAGAPEDGGATGPLVVTTTSGPVEGGTRGEVHAFYGIPYAAPPVGDLRFRAPAPVVPWTEPRDATQLGAYCPQREPIPPLAVRGAESEGCLELNVFTPALAPAAPLPVLVFFHGGAFTLGAATTELYEGDRLAARGAVVVTVNYRLGYAGFLAHPALDAEAGGSSGMYGILDQQAALRWVRDNAAAFGGDPSRVAIFGESAGALSVCVHYFSPGSRGLFAAAISQSGSCFGSSTSVIGPADRAAARARGVEHATALGCPGTDAAAASCLRALPIDTLVDALSTTGFTLGGDAAYGVLSMGPNVDGTVLPDAPEVLVASGAHAGVPYLLGTNRDEGTFFSDDATVTTEEAYAAWVRGFWPEHADAILGLYPVATHGSPLAAYDVVLRDLAFACPTRELARGLSAGGVPVYLYELNHTNAAAVMLGLGVSHGVDLLYVFGNAPLPFARPSAAERNLTESVQAYWTGFAAARDPNGVAAVAWPRHDASDAYLELNDPSVPSTAYYRDACEALAAATAP